MTTITLQQAQATLPELLHSLSIGDEIVITENGIPIAKLARSSPSEIKQQWPCTSGSAKGKIHIAPDFDEPLEDFREYME